ncbi:MAG: glycosyltransferase [Candidatus Coatesbacteria bacterium]|nr:MAG: glycosyltransferase [Candidatus Coatesbacteria bacterium]
MADPRIAVVGMEELPALTAWRLRQAGYDAVALVDVRRLDFLRLAGEFDFCHAVFPTPYFKWVRPLRARGVGFVAHWIGTDLYHVKTQPLARLLFRTAAPRIAAHIADAPWLVEDLARWGIDAALVPTVSGRMDEAGPLPMPDKFAVMAYVPDDRRNFYGWPTVRAVAEAYPDVQVHVVGGDGDGDAPTNVVFHGLTDEMDPIYRAASALIRPTVHDGLSQMVLEALIRGRQVVWSREFPECVYAATTDEFVRAVGALRADCPFNDAGALLAAEQYSPPAAVESLKNVYSRLLSESGK